MSFTLGNDDHGDFIICDACGMKSYHPMDVREKWCGKCEKYHEGEGYDMRPKRES